VVTLVLGGARSGKSEVAERLAGRLSATVTYVATGPPVAAARAPGAGPVDDVEWVRDAGWAARVQAHRARRPAGWATVEVPPGSDLAAVVRSIDGVVVVDSLGTWLAGRQGFRTDPVVLCAALSDRTGDTVVVSEEVGLGVHPSSEEGRLFRDALGALNLRVAEVADRVLLVVAGRALDLEAPGPPEQPGGGVE
jgi:adenosylcobinamide kinase/adenosylcobinamide-phosphate guanylyltransferase